MKYKMNILDKIIDNKRLEVERKKKVLPLETIENARFSETRNFKASIEKREISIIAEIKRISPSSGIIRKDFDLIKIAKEYESNGASAISVLTDGKFFGGSNKHIELIKNEVNLPILRKDFIIDEYQIYESRCIGADAVLLIAKILSVREMERFISIAKKLGLACLVEVHTEDELERVFSTNSDIIGINNRNLESLRVEIETSLSLKRIIPEEYITVSESGIKRREDVVKLEDAGFDAVLVGEALMKAKNPSDKLRELSGKFTKEGKEND